MEERNLAKADIDKVRHPTFSQFPGSIPVDGQQPPV